MTISSERLQKMLAAAEKATPGPYRADAVGLYLWAPSKKDGDFPLADGGGHDGLVARMRGWGYYTGRGSGGLALSADEAVAATRRDLSHIANCDPATVRDLITELLGLRAAAAEVIAQNQEYLTHLNNGAQSDPLTIAVDALATTLKDNTHGA